MHVAGRPDEGEKLAEARRRVGGRGGAGGVVAAAIASGDEAG